MLISVPFCNQKQIPSGSGCAVILKLRNLDLESEPKTLSPSTEEPSLSDPWAAPSPCHAPLSLSLAQGNLSALSPLQTLF